MSENKRRIQAYPTRSFTAEDEAWNKFREHKEKSGGNWTQFIKRINELLEGERIMNANQQDNPH